MLTFEQANERLSYDPDTGVLTWKIRASTRLPGCVAGSRGVNSNGKSYIRIDVLNKTYLAHRLAWLLMTGSWPSQIDHRDGNGCNNSWHNLRETSQQDNMRNRRLSRSNTSGVCGVYWDINFRKWVAFITCNRKLERIGCFVTKEEAVSARKSAEMKYGFDPNHGTQRSL